MPTEHERIKNRKELQEVRSQLRQNMTAAETRLWQAIKGSQLENRKFRRQHSVGPFVLDFYCPSEQLAIELDGKHHFTDGGQVYDQARTDYLAEHQIRVLRFENKLVFDDLAYVLKSICLAFKQNS